MEKLSFSVTSGPGTWDSGSQEGGKMLETRGGVLGEKVVPGLYLSPNLQQLHYCFFVFNIYIVICHLKKAYGPKHVMKE